MNKNLGYARTTFKVKIIIFTNLKEWSIIMSLWDSLSKTIETIKKERVVVKISEKHIEQLLKEKLQSAKLTINEVSIASNHLIINGTVKKGFVPLQFRMVLSPVGFEERIVHLKIIKVSPVHMKWLNKKLLSNQSKLMLYENEVISININKIDLMNNLPIGVIKEFYIVENRFEIKIGV